MSSVEPVLTTCLVLQLSGDEASNGLVLPAVATAYFGKAGAILVVIMCFMAVTSSGAGEILAASSLFTFDIYRKYIRPKVMLYAIVIIMHYDCYWVTKILSQDCLQRYLATSCTRAVIAKHGDVSEITAAGMFATLGNVAYLRNCVAA